MKIQTHDYSLMVYVLCVRFCMLLWILSILHGSSYYHVNCDIHIQYQNAGENYASRNGHLHFLIHC